MQNKKVKVILFEDKFGLGGIETFITNVILNTLPDFSPPQILCYKIGATTETPSESCWRWTKIIHIKPEII